VFTAQYKLNLDLDERYAWNVKVSLSRTALIT
jgi:hypothetical protein